MSSSSRRILPPGSASRKRKEGSGNDFQFLKPPHPPAAAAQATKLGGAANSFRPPPASQCNNNKLLAGYLAHEFLTKGTMLGEKFDPARAEAVAVQRRRVVKQEQVEAGAAAREEYAEVANIIKTEGNYIPGIVNPTQLSRWIQM